MHDETNRQFESFMRSNLESRVEAVNDIFNFLPELTSSLQSNTLTDQQLSQIKGELTNERVVLTASQDFLKRMEKVVSDLAVFITEDHGDLFSANKANKQALLTVLNESLAFIQEAQRTKEGRDYEEIGVQEYLLLETAEYLKGIHDIVKKYSPVNPSLLTQKDEAIRRTQALIDIIQKIDPAAKMPRIRLKNIDHIMDRTVRSSLHNGMSFVYDDEAQKTAQEVLERLVETTHVTSTEILKPVAAESQDELLEDAQTPIPPILEVPITKASTPETTRPEVITLDGKEIPKALYLVTLVSLESLLKKMPKEVTSLYTFAAMDAPLSPQTSKILQEYGLIQPDGSLNDVTRTIVENCVSFDMGDPVVIDVFRKKSEEVVPESVTDAVASLTTSELIAMNLTFMLGNFGPHIIGYEKIAPYVVDGNPTSALKEAVSVAFSEMDE